MRAHPGKNMKEIGHQLQNLQRQAESEIPVELTLSPPVFLSFLA